MTCPGLEPYVQIGLTKVKPVSVSGTLGPTPGSSSISVSFDVDGSSSYAPHFPTYIGFFDKNNRKIFAGIAQSFTKSYFNQRKTFQIQGNDFSYFTNLHFIKNYGPDLRASFKDHVNNLLALSGAYDPNRPFNAISPTGIFNPLELLFSCSQITLTEALNQLCTLFGYRWTVSMGTGWNTLDVLLAQSQTNGGFVCELIFTALDASLSPLGQIILPFQHRCDLNQRIWNPKFSMSFGDVASRVLVTGRNGSLELGRKGRQTRVTTYDLLSNATQQRFKLDPLTVLVNRVEMVKVVRLLTVSPLTASVGDGVTLTGVYFSNTTDISFNGTPVTSFTVVDDATVTTTVPTGATTGRVQIETSDAGTAFSAGAFTVV